MHDSASLTTNQAYRIVDYKTTVSQEDYNVASNYFDIIVTASSPSTLEAEAIAVPSERDADGYFADSDLSKWKLWYLIDNTKIGWASPEGTGVIYRMIDEFENDFPYDFKNILIPTYKLGSGSITVSFSDGTSMSLYPTTSSSPDYSCYTGIRYVNTGTMQMPMSVTYYVKNGSVIGSPVYTGLLMSGTSTFSAVAGSSITSLPEQVVVPSYTIGTDSDLSKTEAIGVKQLINNYENQEILPSNKFGARCHNVVVWGGENITIGSDCDTVEIGDCYDINIGNFVSEVYLGHGCYDITVTGSTTYDKAAHNIQLGNGCYDMTFSTDVYNVVMGDECHNNTIGSGVYNVTMGSGCYNNSLKNRIQSSTDVNDGGNTYSITLGDECHSNTFDGSNGNTLGNSCSDNRFTLGGANTLGNNCSSNTFSIASYQFNALTSVSSCARNVLHNNSSYNKFTIASGNKVSGSYNTLFGQAVSIGIWPSASYTFRYCNNNTIMGDYVYLHYGCENNVIKGGEYITLLENCENNTIGQNCSWLNLDSGTYQVEIGDNCRDINIGIDDGNCQLKNSVIGDNCAYLAIKLNQESTGDYAKVQVTDNTSGKRGDKKYFYVKAVEATDIDTLSMVVLSGDVVNAKSMYIVNSVDELSTSSVTGALASVVTETKEVFDTEESLCYIQNLKADADYYDYDPTTYYERGFTKITRLEINPSKFNIDLSRYKYGLFVTLASTSGGEIYLGIMPDNTVMYFTYINDVEIEGTLYDPTTEVINSEAINQVTNLVNNGDFYFVLSGDIYGEDVTYDFPYTREVFELLNQTFVMYGKTATVKVTDTDVELYVKSSEWKPLLESSSSEGNNETIPYYLLDITTHTSGTIDNIYNDIYQAVVNNTPILLKYKNATTDKISRYGSPKVTYANAGSADFPEETFYLFLQDNASTINVTIKDTNNVSVRNNVAMAYATEVYVDNKLTTVKPVKVTISNDTLSTSDAKKISTFYYNGSNSTADIQPMYIVKDGNTYVLQSIIKEKVEGPNTYYKVTFGGTTLYEYTWAIDTASGLYACAFVEKKEVDLLSILN